MGASASRILTWATITAVFLLMTIGNVVSSTGSGLACPDWPLCHGRLVPPLRPDVLVEYGHRLAAALTSALLVTAIVVTMRRAAAPGARRLAGILLGLLALQIALGGITVLLRLPHLISTAHLVNALLILGGLLLLASEARPGAPRATALDPATAKVAALARVGLAVLLLQMALGGYVRHTGAGLACPDFPLCGGDLLPQHWLAAVHWTHRWLGVTLLGLFVHLPIAGRRTALRSETLVTALLALLQVALGIATVTLGLEPPIRAAHAAAGYALWGALVWTSAGAGCWRSALAVRPAGREPLGEVVRAS